MAKAAIDDAPQTTGPDVDLAITRLHALTVVAQAETWTAVHEGTPRPKARARTTRQGHVYTPATTRAAEADLVRVFRRAWGARPMLRDTVALVALFYVPTRQPKDADNLVKLLKDALTKSRVWKDDRLVKAMTVFVELDVLRPRTVIALAPCLSSMTKAPLLVGAV
jgi:Holliday junction resolvase RusA-like endonuclease